MKLCAKNILFIFIAIFSLLISACKTFQIVDLKQQSLTSNNLKHSINSSAGVETIQVAGGGYGDATKWQQGLADALRKEGVFKTVSYPFTEVLRFFTAPNFFEHAMINFSGEVIGLTIPL